MNSRQQFIGLGIGIALILGANAVAILGINVNRSGEPDSTVRLTQRELTLSGSSTDDENSGYALRLKWRVFIKDPESTNLRSYRYSDSSYSNTPAWLDNAKLRTLQFAFPEPGTNSSCDIVKRFERAKEVFLVLENNGPEYQRALEQARSRAQRIRTELVESEREFEYRDEVEKNTEEDLREEETTKSRLFFVDAGLDSEALRAKFPDRHKHSIMRGVVRINVITLTNGAEEPILFENSTDEDSATQSRSCEVRGGAVQGLSITHINLPLDHQRQLLISNNKRVGRLRLSDEFEIEVAVGRSLEPWIISATNREQAR